jgi:ubiquinone/menaquinone biosynthesis C-methylase UbiE
MQSHDEKGFLQRIQLEIRHWRRREWSFEDVGQHWDDTEDYDAINEQTYSYFRRFIDGRRLSNLKPGSHVLDFCARTGMGTAYFYKHGLVGSAVCADVSKKMGEICTKRLKEEGFSEFEWILLQDYELPFNDRTFDAILCFETVEHFSLPVRLIEEMGRVIRAGGTMILTTPNVLWEPIHAIAAVLKLHHSEGPHRFIRYKNLTNMIKSAGFKIEAAETTVLIPSGPSALIRIGEWIEKRTRRWLMPMVGLRRVIVARKDEADD